MKKKSFGSLVSVPILILLSISALFQFSPVAIASNPNCPSNEILHVTSYGGAPSSFNTLTGYNPAGFLMAELEWASGGTPINSPLGIPQNYSTVSDNVTSNSNYTVWTVHIRPGEKWSDGTNITAADYISDYSPNFALNPSFDPIGIHSEVTSVTAVGSNTVVFTLNQSDAHFPDKMDINLAAPLYPKSFTSNNASFNGFGTVVTSGPFYHYNYVAGSNTVNLYKNPYFTPQPSVCEIKWNLVESESQDSTYIASGASDLAPVVPSAVSSLLSIPGVQILPQPDEYMTFLGYNVTQYPYNMTQFRQALVFGINQTALVDGAFSGYASPAYTAEGSVAPQSIYYNSNQMQYSFNQNKSTALLSSIGITKGSDGFLQYPNRTDVSLTIWADTDVTMNTIAAQSVQSDLETLGFKVNLELASTSTLIGYLFSNTFNADNDIVLHTTNAYNAGDPFFIAQAWPITMFPEPFDGTWENPPSAQAAYQGNLTALTRTANAASIRTYLGNIEALNAQYLPGIPLVYGDNIFAYRTDHFTNWPSGNSSYIFESFFWNYTALAGLQPVGSNSTSSSSTSPSISTTSTASVSSTSSVASSSSSTATSASSSTASSSSSSLLLIATVVIVIIVVAAVAAALLRRARK